MQVYMSVIRLSYDISIVGRHSWDNGIFTPTPLQRPIGAIGPIDAVISFVLSILWSLVIVAQQEQRESYITPYHPAK